MGHAKYSNEVCRGVHNLRGIQFIRTLATMNKDENYYLKLYLLNRKRSSIRKRQARLYSELDSTNAQLKDIEKYIASVER